MKAPPRLTAEFNLITQKSESLRDMQAHAGAASVNEMVQYALSWYDKYIEAQLVQLTFSAIHTEKKEYAPIGDKPLPTDRDLGTVSMVMSDKMKTMLDIRFPKQDHAQIMSRALLLYDRILHAQKSGLVIGRIDRNAKMWRLLEVN